MSEYVWNNPLEWLTAKIDGLDSGTGLAEIAKALAAQLSSDQIQDLFESEMDTDGYFLKGTRK